MVRFGVCMVPFGNPSFDHSWLQPKPTVTSWKALKGLGITDVRLQFDVGGDLITREAPVSTKMGAWDTSLFRAFITPAWQAGMRINANYCISDPVPAHQDAAFRKEGAFKLVQEFGHMITDYSFGNEPGADAKKYEEVEIPPPSDGGSFSHRDYMQDIYFPQLYLPFARGVRRANPTAWIYGCDADSTDIQKRFTDLDISCNEEAIHPYGDVGGGDYATMGGKNGKPGFMDVKTSRPIGITEIDHQQLPSAKEKATIEELNTLLDFSRMAVKFPITRLYYGSVEYFFEEGKNSFNLACSSFYTNPVVSKKGKEFAQFFASVNGRQRSVKKG